MKNTSLPPVILFAVVVFLAQQCATPYTPERLPAQYLCFGAGGGFSGEVTTWTLLPNGQIFKSVGLDGPMMEWKGHVRREGRKAFREAEALRLADRPPFSHPGNRYSFVEWIEGERRQRITWGSREHAVDSAVEALHRRLMALTRTRE